MWETYSEVDAKVKALASAYSAVGLKPVSQKLARLSAPQPVLRVCAEETVIP